MDSLQPTTAAALPEAPELLKISVCAFVDAIVAQSEDAADKEFGHLHERARALVQHKISMGGTKSETRDLLGEIVFSRLRRGLRTFVRSADGRNELRAAEWVMGSLLSMTTLAEFAAALDRAILEASAPREYSFAGMADFISINEVLQLLGSGRHVGCLSLEKPDNRIDVYLSQGRIAFLDPHHMVRRVLPGSGPMGYREISEDSLRAAERRQSDQGQALFLALKEEGLFKDNDLRAVMTELGCEVFYEFLLDPHSVFYSYKRLAELPAFAKEHELRLGITGLLLEGNKRLDDWKSMCKVFPDPDEPLTPAPELYAKIGGLDLGIIEIKLLSHLNGESSPRAISQSMGLPLYETYQHLIRLAREGAIETPGAIDSIEDVSLSVEESMQAAFAALDANDDQLQVTSALDKVLGGGMFGGGGGSAPGGKNGADEVKVSLDFLKVARRD